LPICIFTCFIPFGVTTIQGQDSILLATLFTASAVSMEDGNDWLAGILLALALFKFQFVLPIVALFVVWKRWKVAGGFLCGGLIVAALSLAVAGTASISTYWFYLSNMSVKLDSVTQAVYSIHPSAMPNLRGAISVLSGPLAGQRASQALTALASLILFFWAARQKPSFAVAVVTAILVSYHCLFHDLSILIVPLVTLTSREYWPDRSWAWAAAIFGGLGFAFAWQVPYWILSFLLLAFLLHIVRTTSAVVPGRPASLESP
jgi:hypothetical protein